MNLKNVIKRPIITEKSIQQAGLGEYTFAVDRQANKNQIRKAVEEFFGVTVIGVRTLKVGGKTRRVGRRRKKVRLADWKKAVVKLKEGDKIEYFETGGSQK